MEHFGLREEILRDRVIVEWKLKYPSNTCTVTIKKVRETHPLTKSKNLFTTFYNLSVSWNHFSKAEVREITQNLEQWEPTHIRLPGIVELNSFIRILYLELWHKICRNWSKFFKLGHEFNTGRCRTLAYISVPHVGVEQEQV